MNKQRVGLSPHRKSDLKTPQAEPRCGQPYTDPPMMKETEYNQEMPQSPIADRPTVL